MHRPFQLHSSLFLRSLLALLAVISLPSCLSATTIATGSIQVSNLTITPGSGTVVFLTPWTAQAFAEAQNSSCGCQSQFDSSVGGIAQANAMVQFANGHGLANAANPFLMASAAVDITGGGPSAASAIGQAVLFNTGFEITGGTGPVDVSFMAMLVAMQTLMTDAEGVFAGTDASFTLSVNGQNVLFYDSSNQIGPSSSWTSSFSGSLDGNLMLTFGDMNNLTLEVETDPSGYSIPEPPTVWLALFGASIPFIRRVLRSR